MSSVDRCGSLVRSRYFPSSFASAATFAASRRSSPDGVVRRNRARPGLGGDHPAQLGPLGRRRAGRSRRSSPPAGRRAFARTAASRSAASGLWQTTNRSCSTDLDLLDPQVRGHLLVAALARQRGGGLRRAGAQLLAQDVAVRRRRPGGGGSAAEVNPRSATQMTFPSVQSRSSSLTWRISGESRGVARPAPHPHRDPVAGHGHPDHHLGQVVAGVLGLAVGAEPGLPRRALGRPRRPPSARRRCAFVLGPSWRGAREDAAVLRRARPARRPARSRSRCWWCRRRSGRLRG